LDRAFTRLAQDEKPERTRSQARGGRGLGSVTHLILKRAWARPSGQWNDEDYDVLADGEVVGRIFQVSRNARRCHDRVR
jgi:hypothetical protein